MANLDRSVDNAFDLRNKNLQDVLECRNMSPGWPLGMAYGYIHGNIVIVVHLSLRGVEDEKRDFCAISYRAKNVMNLSWADDWPVEGKLPSTRMLGCNMEQPMLVRIVEFAEHPEKGRELMVNSIVRLRTLDECPGLATQQGNSGSLLVKSLGGTDNRELKPSGIGRRVGSTLLNSQGIDKMIKSGPKIVDAITSDQSPSIYGRRVLDINNEAVAATIGITFLGENVGVAVTPRIEFGLESLEVFFSAAYLQPATSELRSDHAIYCTKS